MNLPASKTEIATEPGRRIPSTADLLAICLRDQRERAPKGELLSVEIYVQRYPQLGDDPECVQDLIYNEFVLREQQGEPVRSEDFIARFPDFADQLRVQFEVHRAIEGSDELLGAELEDDFEPDESSSEADGLPHVEGYELLGLLGSGGMGVVYRARHKRLNRIVALKVVRAQPFDAPDQRRRFHREAELAARLQHPNIVQVFDTGEQLGEPFIAFELVEGGTLAQKLGGRPLRPSNAAQLAETLARAAHYAHQHGVVHRDLKPANILMAPSLHLPRTELDPTAIDLEGFEPKIADFGLAKPMQCAPDITQTWSLMGTPGYMAPEQIDGGQELIGPVTDVYALGVILYETLTGRVPFVATTTLETLEQLRRQEPIPPRYLQPKLPYDLQTICLKCLEKSPARRYADAHELAEDLRRFQVGEPIHARPVSLVEQAWRRFQRNPTVSLLSALLVIAITVSFVTVTYLWRQTEGLLVETQSQKAHVEKAQQASEHSFQKAHAAIQQAIQALQSKPLDPTLQRQLIDPFVAYFEELVADRNHNPLVRADLTEMWSMLGAVRERSDAPSDALRCFVKVLALQFEQWRSDPQNLAASDNIANVCDDIARVLATLGYEHESQSYLRRARQIREARQTSKLAEWLRIALEPVAPTTPERLQASRDMVVNSIGQRMRQVPAGEFRMGSPETEPFRSNDEGPQRAVNITRPFFMGIYEVTQQEFAAVMQDTPAYFNSERGGGGDHPVEYVSWRQANEFCKRLSELPAEQAAHRVYRLPTETEWEYACRAGSDRPFANGDSLKANAANFDSLNTDDSKLTDAFRIRTTPVGTFAPNAWGLYDMHGNVGEWCQDRYTEDYSTQANDIAGPVNDSSGAGRVIRGGHWLSSARVCRSAYRFDHGSMDRCSYVGFRVVMSDSPLPSSTTAPTPEAGN